MTEPHAFVFGVELWPCNAACAIPFQSRASLQFHCDTAGGQPDYIMNTCLYCIQCYEHWHPQPTTHCPTNYFREQEIDGLPLPFLCKELRARNLAQWKKLVRWENADRKLTFSFSLSPLTVGTIDTVIGCFFTATCGNTYGRWIVDRHTLSRCCCKGSCFEGNLLVSLLWVTLGLFSEHSAP